MNGVETCCWLGVERYCGVAIFNGNQRTTNINKHRIPGLHSKIWGLVKLKPTLFRKAVVTREHYDILQNILNQKYPDRNTKEYDGGDHDVTSDKLYVLEEIALAEPDLDGPEAISGDDGLEASKDDDGQEANNGDDSEINTSFPFTLRYLNLSSLGLESMPDRFPLPLYRCEEYHHISWLIKKHPETGNNSFIVSGQPGTGEVLVSLSHKI